MIKYTDLPDIIFVSLLVLAAALDHYFKYGLPSAITAGTIICIIIIAIRTLMPKYMDWAYRKDKEKQKRKEAKS